jgi:hypothetical protein
MHDFTARDERRVGSPTAAFLQNGALRGTFRREFLFNPPGYFANCSIRTPSRDVQTKP